MTFEPPFIAPATRMNIWSNHVGGDRESGNEQGIHSLLLEKKWCIFSFHNSSRMTGCWFFVSFGASCTDWGANLVWFPMLLAPTRTILLEPLGTNKREKPSHLFSTNTVFPTKTAAHATINQHYIHFRRMGNILQGSMPFYSALSLSPHYMLVTVAMGTCTIAAEKSALCIYMHIPK